jgi:flagellar biosynthesis/type III secretory pathway protein FliH
MSPSASRLVDAAVEPIAWPAHVPAGAASHGHASDGRWLVELDEPAPRHTAADRAADHDKQIYARGYADGQHAAMAAADLQSHEQSRRLITAVAAIAHLRQQVMLRAERDLVTLALAIASRVVHREIRQDPAQLAAMARQAVARLGDRVDALVRLNPDDLAAVREAGAADDRATVQLVADANVPTGGCVVESAAGRVDTGLDAQMREIAKMLDEAEGTAHAGAPDA